MSEKKDSFDTMDSTYPTLYKHEVKAIRDMMKKEFTGMLDEALSKKVDNFSPHDLQNGAFLELLIQEFQTIKAEFEDMKNRRHPASLGFQSGRENIDTKVQAKAMDDILTRLDKLEELMSDPHLLLKKSIEGFKIK